MNLPKSVRAIADIVGESAALELARTCGGVEQTYIPLKPTEPHPWRAVLGPAAFKKVCAKFGGQRIDLARAVEIKKPLIAELLRKGELSACEIALKVGVTARHVRRVHRSLVEGP